MSSYFANLVLIKEKKPLIHCITNPISIHDCANVVLAVGARPMMAEHPLEVEEVTSSAGALLLNLGNITDARLQSMAISTNVARNKGLNVVIDAVGVAASKLRRDFALKLIAEGEITLIKGNLTEIYSLFSQESGSGVDVLPQHELDEESLDKHIKSLKNLSKSINIPLFVTGKFDIVVSGNSATVISGGCEKLAQITGTGCMVGALCATFCAVTTPLNAAILASSYFKVAGEMADNQIGLGSFAVALHDSLSEIDLEKLNEKLENNYEF